jgi:hypothetical protein
MTLKLLFIPCLYRAGLTVYSPFMLAMLSFIQRDNFHSSAIVRAAGHLFAQPVGANASASKICNFSDCGAAHESSDAPID